MHAAWRPALVAVLWTKAVAVMVVASLLDIDILADWSLLVGLAALAVTADHLLRQARGNGSDVTDLMELASRNGDDVRSMTRR